MYKGKTVRIGALALLALSLVACNQKKFNVEGNITEAADSMLYLENVGLEGITAIDSAKLSADGAFSFSGEAPTSEL